MTDPNVPSGNAPEVNRQFFFKSESSGVTPPAPASKKRELKALTASSALVIGAIVGGLFGGSAGVAGFLVATRPAPVVVNNTDSVTWVTGVAAKSLPSVVTI